MNPLVSIIIPAFNAEKYIRETIDSILAQTFTKFEILIIDDGSKDNTATLVDSYLKDARVKYFYKNNGGPSSARNYGISLAVGRYICCVDSDDVCHPNRFEKQVNYLESNIDVGLCGTWGATIDKESKKIIPAVSDVAIKANMLFDSQFIHSSVMFRSEVIKALDVVYKDILAEDYELFFRLCSSTKVHNIPEYLIKYRIRPGQISQDNAEKLFKDACEVRYMQLARLLCRSLSMNDKKLYVMLLTADAGDKSLGFVLSLAFEMLEANLRGNIYSERALAAVMRKRIKRLVKNANLNLPNFVSWLKSIPRISRYFGASVVLFFTLRLVLG